MNNLDEHLNEFERLLKQEAAQRGLPLTEDVRLAIMQEWVNNSAADPVVQLLNEVQEAETQREIADIIAANRDFLSGLSRERRDYALWQINEMADERPEI
jgi:hypothetical protein